MLQHLFLRAFNGLATSDRIAIVSVIVTLIVGIFGAAIASILGARYGAFTGAKLTREQQKQDLQDKRYSALIATQFALIYQWRSILDLCNQHLDKWKDDSLRYLKMPSSIIIAPPLRIPLSDIIFIAESKEASYTPDVLHKIQIAEENFNIVIASFFDVANEKNAVLSDKNVVQGFDIQSQQWLIRNNPAALARLLESTNLLYNQIEVSVPPIKEAVKGLGKYVQKCFPDRKALDMALPDGSTIFGGEPLKQPPPNTSPIQRAKPDSAERAYILQTINETLQIERLIADCFCRQLAYCVAILEQDGTDASDLTIGLTETQYHAARQQVWNQLEAWKQSSDENRGSFSTELLSAVKSITDGAANTIIAIDNITMEKSAMPIATWEAQQKLRNAIVGFESRFNEAQ